MTWCDTIDDRAAELALGIVDEPEQTELMSHVEGCDRCRRLIEDLSEAADRVVLAAPEIEPPIGFESRAISVMGGESAPFDPPSSNAHDRPERGERRIVPRRGGQRAAAVAVAAALVAVLGAIAFERSTSTSTPSATAASTSTPPTAASSAGSHDVGLAPSGTLWSTDGADVGGAVVINSPEPVLVMWLDGARAGAPYGCTVVFRDGTSSDVGTWTPRESDTTWSVPLDARSTDAVALVVTGSYGREIARADLE